MSSPSNNLMPTSNSREISLNEVAKLANMPESYFSRFIKRHTGRTFVDTLNEIRLGYATRMLIETTHTIAEIAYSSGFDNVTYFNRILQKKRRTAHRKRFGTTIQEPGYSYSCIATSMQRLNVAPTRILWLATGQETTLSFCFRCSAQYGLYLFSFLSKNKNTNIPPPTIPPIQPLSTACPR